MLLGNDARWTVSWHGTCYYWLGFRHEISYLEREPFEKVKTNDVRYHATME